MTSGVTPDPQRRDWTKWLTAFVGVATAITGIIQFYYKEIFAPAKVPVNISLGLEISPLKPDKGNEGDIIPAFMQTRISNTGNKSVYLKGPIWMAFGIRRNGQPRSPGSFTIPKSPEFVKAWCPGAKPPSSEAELEDEFVQCWNRKLAAVNEVRPQLAAPSEEKYPQAFTDRIELIPPTGNNASHYFRELNATGPINKDTELKPGQVVESHILIPVSTKPHYHYLEAVLAVPTVSGISQEQADKIASVAFINLQDSLLTAPRVYERLRGFCLVRPRPFSWVNVLNAFRLPGREDGEMSSSLGKKNTGICYTSAHLPRGKTNDERFMDWSGYILSQRENDKYGAQIYDATYEVPLFPYGGLGPAMKGAEQP